MRLVFNPLKKILDFIVYSNFFISVCVAFFTIQTALIFPSYSENILDYVLPNFLATFVLYHFQRLYFAAKYPQNIKYHWYTKNRRLIFTLVFLLIICSFTPTWNLLSENPTNIIVYGCLSLLSVLYFLPPFNFRKYGLLKPFIIAFVFVFISILLPLQLKFNFSIIVYLIGQFSFIAALAMLFDIRDLENDQNANVFTFPVKLGLKKSKILTVVLLLFYFTSTLFFTQTNFMITAFIIVIASLALTFFAKPSRHNYYYLFLVDGCIILQCILLLLIKN